MHPNIRSESLSAAFAMFLETIGKFSSEQSEKIRESIGSEHGKFLALQPVLQEMDNLTREIREEFIKNAISGQYSLLGYSLPRRAEDQPAEVPRDILTGVIKWEADEIRARSLTMCEVRVADPGILDMHAIKSLPTKRRGAKGYSDTIIATFERLKSSEKLKATSTKREILAAVRRDVANQIGAQDPNIRGLGPKTVWQLIQPRLPKGWQAGK